MDDWYMRACMHAYVLYVRACVMCTHVIWRTGTREEWYRG